MFTSFEKDRDFIALWKSTSQFFAYYVVLARKYSKFFKNEELLLEYLQQRGLLICNDETLENLQFLMKHYYDEIRKRGTIQIIRKRTIVDHDNSDSDSDSYSEASHEVNGELLRSICYDDCDEFIFNFRKSEKLGLNIGNSSPLYRGLSNMSGANKIWVDFLASLTDYLKFPIFGNVSSVYDEPDQSDSHSNSNSYSLDEDIVIKISHGTSGFGLDNINPYSLQYILQYALNVNINIDYQFSFRIKQDKLKNGILNFGVNAFDCDGNIVNLLSATTLTVSHDFILNDQLNIIDKYYEFRGIIYAFNKVLYNTKTSWNKGNNLLFTQNVKKIIPYIKVINSDATVNVYVTEVKLQPAATNYSSGFIQTNNWIDFWIKNNNQNYSYQQLKDLFRKYLLPYDTNFEFNELEEEKLP